MIFLTLVPTNAVPTTKKCNLFLFTGWLLAAALLLPYAANAQTSSQKTSGGLYEKLLLKGPDESDKGNGGIWRPFNDVGAKIELDTSVDCTPKPDCINDHGTYERDPYYRILKEEDGTLVMISDQSLRATLTHTDKPKKFNIHATWEQTETLKLPQTVTATGILNFTGKHGALCHTAFCFEVSGMPDNGDLANGAYVVAKKKPTPDRGKNQDLASMFTHFPAQFNFVRNCYNIVSFDPLAPISNNCPKNLFADPAKTNSMGYSEVHPQGPTVAVPFGWIYRSLGSITEGSNKTTFIESGRDVVSAHQKSIGWKTGLDLYIVNFSVNHNKTVSSRVENVSKNEMTYTEYNYLNEQFALVVDKANLTLDPMFVAAVQHLLDKVDQSEMDTQCQQYKTVLECELNNLIVNYGTHYAYATTYGQVGQLVNTMTKDQVMALHETGVDLTTGASAGFKIPLTEDLKGPSISGEGGVDSGTAQTNKTQIENTLQKNMGKFRCLGSVSCSENGMPGGEGVAPVRYDLRPISDLLGPPFFTEHPKISGLRDQLRKSIAEHIYGLNPQVAKGEVSARFYKFTDITLDKCMNETRGFVAMSPKRAIPCTMLGFGVENKHFNINSFKWEVGQPSVKVKKEVIVAAPSYSSGLAISGIFDIEAIWGDPKGRPKTCRTVGGATITPPTDLHKPASYPISLYTDSNWCAEDSDDWFSISFTIEAVSVADLLLPLTVGAD